VSEESNVMVPKKDADLLKIQDNWIFYLIRKTKKAEKEAARTERQAAL